MRILLGDEESVLWYSELLLSVFRVCAYVFERLLVEAHLCKRFEDPNKRKLCLLSRLRGVGNEELRRFEVRGYKILSFELP